MITVIRKNMLTLICLGDFIVAIGIFCREDFSSEENKTLRTGKYKHWQNKLRKI